MSDECFCAVEPWPGGAWPPLCDYCERKSKAVAVMREVTDPMAAELSQLRAQLDAAKRVIDAVRKLDVHNGNAIVRLADALRDYDAKHGTVARSAK